MLVIRFFRVGKKKQPSFKIVVTDKKNPPQGGRFVDEVGSWNPLTKDKNLDKEKIQKWLSQGAKPSSAVYNLLVREGILIGAKIPVHKKKKIKGGETQAEEGEVKKTSKEEAEKAETEEKPGEEAKTEEAKREEAPKEKVEKARVEEKREEKKEEKKEEKPEEKKAKVKPSQEDQKGEKTG